MARARSRRSEPLTRDVIVAAARQMLDTTDLETLSLRRLATELGVTAPALYAHMEDKRDLLAAVAEQGFAELVEAFEQVDSEDPRERLVAYGKAYVDKAVDDPEVFRAMFLFRPGIDPLPNVDNELPAATITFEHPFKAVSDAIAAGAIHPDRDPLLTAMTLWTTAHGLASVLLLGSSGGEVILPDNAEALIDDVLSVTIAGLESPPTT